MIYVSNAKAMILIFSINWVKTSLYCLHASKQPNVHCPKIMAHLKLLQMESVQMHFFVEILFLCRHCSDMILQIQML